MELKQLVYFIEVAKREHMSEAAANLQIAQSAVSRQIINLEKELGVSLFEREGRNIKLLPVGRVFQNQIIEMMRILDQAKQQVREFNNPETGTIKLGFPTSLATTMLPQLINIFSQSYPDIKFQLRQGSHRFLIDSVKQRELDIALLGPVITDDPSLNGDILFDETFDALLPRNHRFANRKSIDLLELKEEPFILFPKGYILEKLVNDACEKDGFTPKVHTEGEDLDAIKGMVSAGIGITLLPKIALYNQQNEYIKQVPVHSKYLKRNVGMITPRTRELGASEKVFRQFVIDFFRT